jgi:1-phosphofructokinase family hexose kinase
MILTVNANAALDRSLFIDAFEPMTVMHSGRVIESIGGKGLDTSVALQSLGVENIAMSFIAGKTGEAVVGFLDDYGIEHDLIWVAGDTRTAHVIVEMKHHRHSHIMTPGYTITLPDEENFLERFRRRVKGVKWVVIAGSMPPGLRKTFYKTLMDIGEEAGARILIDCRGEPILRALPAKPAVIKMNRSEFNQTFATNVQDMSSLNIEGRRVLDHYGLEALVVTNGEKGILAVTADQSFLAVSPPQQVVSAAGAGDAASAGLVWRFTKGDTWPDALRWAAAISAATVLTEATGENQKEDVDRIFPQVDVREI